MSVERQIYFRRFIIMNKHYSETEKKEIVQSFVNGKGISDLQKETGISRSTIYSWVNLYEDEFKSNVKLNLRDYHFVKQRADRLAIIVEILKKSPCAATAPLRERYKAIKLLKSEYSESLLCDALEVSKGSYYNHIFRSKKDVAEYIKRAEELKPIIEEIYIKSNYLYGPPRVQAVMKERGYIVSVKVVARIMHENDWFAIRTSSKRLYEMELNRKKNILNQQFTVSKPNEVWVSDVTQFKVNDKPYYICAIMDLYARKIIAYKISDSNSSRLTINTLNEAFYSRMPNTDELLFHSDNGTNYTSKSFMNRLHELGIKQSFSRPHIPYDNSVMETFFKTLKAEDLYIGRYKTERKFKQGVAAFMRFYNEERAHSVIRYKTPSAYENTYFSHNNT